MDAAEARTVLGVGPRASRQEVERAFRSRAGRHHPDRGGDAERFRRLVVAREVLHRPGRTGPAEPDPGARGGVRIIADRSLLRRLLDGVAGRLRRLGGQEPPPRRVV